MENANTRKNSAVEFINRHLVASAYQAITCIKQTNIAKVALDRIMSVTIVPGAIRWSNSSISFCMVISVLMLLQFSAR